MKSLQNFTPFKSSKSSPSRPGISFLESDPYLHPYEKFIRHRISRISNTEKKLLSGRKISLADFSAGHEYFGLHFNNNEWILREWAPNATEIYMIGDISDWRQNIKYRFEKLNEEGIWEIRLPADVLNHKDYYRLYLKWPGGEGDRIPVYARRVVQDPKTLIFNAQVWNPPSPYQWQCTNFTPRDEPLLIYEVHVGMAQEEGKIGSYMEFVEYVLPRIIKSGYNTIQLMAIQEHPYYGSFGYHVTNFFAASSRFGTPEDLKELIDTAHVSGLRVTMDIIHSHAICNEVEGLSRFDGTPYQYFHEGPRGYHHAWDSRCFNYSKYQVLHFLLSNCRFWLDEYRFDGFRFDGITSMLYLDHGLEKAFTSYDDYFNDNIDEDALTYLALANKVIHEVRPNAVTIAEDISGMPGLAVSNSAGGFGFDYKFAMGIPDNWIKLIKEFRDEDWPINHLWHELNNRRSDEKTISYAESHDQALVGDKTLIFRLIDSDMYTFMGISDRNLSVDRGIALHKMIRLITIATAGNGYLNFMGNEFGHPEWIDFPRQENGWSYHNARRQWHLVDDPNLKYHLLARFDMDMVALTGRCGLLRSPAANLVHEHHDDKIIAFIRGNLLFVFNFHPTRSYVDYAINAPPGKYRMIFDSDAKKYGGHNRLQINQIHMTLHHKKRDKKQSSISLYLPTRTAIVLKPVED